MKKTTEICAAFIPQEIISHLWNIVDIYEEDCYEFILSSRKLGDRRIQDIRIDIDGLSFHHTVLGFQPVDFRLKAYRKGEDFILTLVPSDKAWYEIKKWERIRNLLHSHKSKAPVTPCSIRLRKAS